MSVTRIAEAIHPEWTRNVSATAVRFQQLIGGALRLRQTAADVMVFLLDPAALAAFSLALWRLGEDLSWTGSFFIARGLFSHWQVWIAIAMALKIGREALRRTLQRAPIQQEIRRSS